ncbi:SRPBCC domain-containing protein [Lentzea sp. NPDC058450]|uniref:SRPBCC family protein n=1 Tax=Lentzea sp. NPDC058450 TaxID=3346505 RepID=UPI003669398B
MNDVQATDTPRLEIRVATTVGAAWRALRDKDVIRQWHAWQSGELEAELDSIYFTDVVEDEANHTLVPNGGDKFEIKEDGDGVRIILTRAPLSGDAEWDAYYDDVTEGWTSFLHQLRFALERKPGETRRTLFFGNRGTYSGTVVERLALDGVGEPGSRYTATLAGEAVEGEVWFRSEHQLGVTVDAWGEGLLVIAGTGPSATDPSGTSMALLSTYGLDEDGYSLLDKRWSQWWSENTGK